MSNCFLIGEDPLIMQCTEKLIEYGWHILGIISPVCGIEEWSIKNAIPHFRSLSSAEHIIMNANADCLFSIVNSEIIPSSILNCIRLPINYHNSPLPRYAGVNSPSWAILNNEKIYGVTWHIINKVVDAGDILQQAFFSIESNETAQSLSLKCYHLALPLFETLVEQLNSNSLSRLPQDLSQRTYNGIAKKPSGNGWINWNNEATVIERLFRACRLGSYYNGFSCLKFTLENTSYIISNLRSISQKKSTLAPGTIIKISKNGWRIATKSNDLIISEMRTISGQLVDLFCSANSHQISPGSMLPSPELSLQEYYQNLSENYFPEEQFWIKNWDLNATSLPFLPSNPSHQTLSELRCIQEYDIPKELIETLEEKLKSKFEIILLAIWLVYIYKLGDVDDVAISLSYPELRKHPREIQNLIATYVPFSISITSEMSFEQTLINVQKHFDEIKSKKSYLTDIFYRYPNLNSATKTLLVGMYIDEEANNVETIPFDSSAFLLKMTSNTGRISFYIKESILKDDPNLSPLLANIPKHLEHLLEEAAGNASKKIASLSVLSSAERQKILIDWNRTECHFSEPKSIMHLFDLQVLSAPNRLAIQSDYENITYHELNHRANLLASYLREQGIDGQKFIAIYMPKSINLLIAMLGVLKSGNAYVPIASSYPLEFIKSILMDCKAALVITCESFSENLTKEPLQLTNKSFVCIDEQWFSSRKLVTDIQPNFSPDNLAYLIYTSGTTGLPKGVMLKHKGLFNLIKSFVKHSQITSSSRLLQFSSIGFDASVCEIFTALIGGGTLYLPSEKNILASDILRTVINRNAITHIILPPSILQTLSPFEVPSLEVVVTAGEYCSQELAQIWYTHVKLINAYGPTETTVCATIANISSGERAPSIGRPIANTQAYVLDKDRNPLPIGVTGELYIGGEGIAAGYLNKPELTDKFFVPNPFSTNEDKIYKTRDLVKWLPDSNLEYIGRMDHQIKVRGYRVELEAIESQVLHYLGVHQCAVNLEEDEKRGKYLVAFLVTKDKDFSISHLKKHLKEKLPHYMVPSFFVILDSLPITVNGKIDRSKLPRGSRYIYRDNEYTAPRSNIEKKLKKIWSELLGLELIGIHDNFFDLGGSSLLLTVLFMETLSNLDYDIPIEDFLINPTIAHLSNLINRKKLLSHTYEDLILKDKDLNSKIKPLAFSTHHYTNSILVTGASGFLGTHLLYDLYNLTNSKIYCLVRCRNEEEGVKRLLDSMRHYKRDIDLTAFSERIAVLNGDLSKPQLGLTSKILNSLAEEIEKIYHNAAYVHHLYDYQTLRKTNVLSTIKLLEFAALKRNKQLHYVSTLSALTNHSDTTMIKESFLDYHTLPPALSGYNLTKWVSEALITQAHERGMDVKVYRTGWIFGQSSTGLLPPETNHLLLLLKGCVQIGFAPDWKVNLHISPVDYISLFLAKASLNTLTPHNVFNLVGYPITWHELVNTLNDFGFSMKIVSEPIWQKKIQKIDKNNSLYSLLPLYVSKSGAMVRKVLRKEVIITSMTDNTLKEMDISYNLNKHDYLKKCFSYLSQSGFLEG